jgi:pimeloyl-ACP methyl ester carboxylesterase
MYSSGYIGIAHFQFMKNKNIRKYGKLPYSVLLVHGGPGAAGEIKPVAEKLSRNFGILEPLQTKSSVNDQAEELKEQIEENTNSPVSLVGYSWGAWLAFILAAKYPKLVKKLILVSSGPFEESYAKSIMPTRLSRLKKAEKDRVENLMERISKGETDNKILKELGQLLSKADSYSAEEVDNEVEVNLEIYQKVWVEAAIMRANGKLLELGKNIKCPIVVIHGDYDPHPFEGVKKPLQKVLENMEFILLKKCGHKPWVEKYAKKEFYKTLIAVCS